MGNVQGRAMRGACLWGLLGLLLGAAVGGFWFAPPDRKPERPQQGGGGTNPAEGLRIVLTPVEGAVEVGFNVIDFMFRVAIGGAFGAIAGAVFGAGVATSKDGQASWPSTLETPPGKSKESDQMRD